MNARHILICFGLLSASLIGGCGGSDESESLQFPSVQFTAYSGATSELEIDVTNAKRVAYLATHMLDIAQSLHVFSGIEPLYGERVHALTGEGFDDEDTSDELCTAGGRLDLSERFNERGEGFIVLDFDQCGMDSLLVDGAVVVEGRIAGANFEVKVRMGALHWQSVDDESADEAMTISGEIVSLLNEFGYYRNNTLWTANLVMSAGEHQLYLQNLTREKRSSVSNDYFLRGKLFFSEAGSVDLALDSQAQKLEISASRSNLALNYTLKNLAYHAYFVPVETYAIRLESHQPSIPSQTITLTPDELASSYDRNVGAPQILWRSPAAVPSGQVLSVQPEVDEPDSFIQYLWHLESTNSQCDVTYEDQGNTFNASSDCYGDVSVRLNIFDGFDYFTHHYDLRFKKHPAQVVVESLDNPVSSESAFNLSTTILNPDQGPFDYRMAYGAPGATISDSGVFSWTLPSDYPNLFASQLMHYGIAVTNEDTALVDVPVAVSFDEVSPSTTLQIRNESGQTIPFVFHAVKDIEPDNPAGDISVLASYFDNSMHLIKVNKRTLVANDSLMIRDAIRPDEVADLAAASAYIDWNQDGALDLVFSDVLLSADGLETFTLRINIYDIKNAQMLEQRNVISASYVSGETPKIGDIHAISILGERVTELVISLNEPSAEYRDSKDAKVLGFGTFLFNLETGNLDKISVRGGQLESLAGSEPITSILIKQNEEMELLRWSVATERYQSQGLLNLRNVYGHLANSMRLIAVNHDRASTERTSFRLMLQGNSTQCRLAILRARLMESEIGQVSEQCLVKQLIVNDRLEVLTSELSDYIVADSALVDVPNDGLLSGTMLASMWRTDGSLESIASIDVSSGHVVWRHAFSSEERWGPIAAAEFKDDFGSSRLIVATHSEILVTH